MITPTDEQAAALTLFAAGDGLAIEAGAGTGKTTTLQLLGNSSSFAGQYISFNRQIADDAGARMPSNVSAKTAHQLAYAHFGNDVLRPLLGRGDAPFKRASRLGAKKLTLTVDGEAKELSAGLIVSWADTALGRFYNSTDRDPELKHIPFMDGIDEPDSKGGRTYANNNRLRNAVYPVMLASWAKIQRFEQNFTHDAYLKLWQLQSPMIKADFILFDEAQDASPVMVDVMRQQGHAQLVFVGDTQQQIYEWRGAVNALSTVPHDATTFLTQSFRFGPAIAEVANACLDKLDADLRLEGAGFAGSKIDRCLNAHVVLCRSNARAMREVVRLQSLGCSTFLAGGVTDLMSFVRAAGNLIDGKRVHHAMLAAFKSWAEVLFYVRHDKGASNDLRQWAYLVEDYGVSMLFRTLDACTKKEAEAECVVSTVHKAKGREWETVRLADDFPDVPSTPEWRLLYVAATRAKKVLDLSECPPFKKLGFA